MSEKICTVEQVISLLKPHVDEKDDQDCPYMVLIGSRAVSFHCETKNTSDWDLSSTPSAAISFLKCLDSNTSIRMSSNENEKKRKDFMILGGHDVKNDVRFDICIVVSKSGAIVQDFDIVRFVHQHVDKKFSQVLGVTILVAPLDVCEMIKTSHVHLSEDFTKHVESLHDIRDVLFENHNANNEEDNTPLLKRSKDIESFLTRRSHQKYLHLRGETLKCESKECGFESLSTFEEKIQFVLNRYEEIRGKEQVLKTLATGYPVTPFKEFIVNNYVNIVNRMEPDFFNVYVLKVGGNDDYGALCAEEIGISKLFAYCEQNQKSVERQDYWCTVFQHATFSTEQDAKIAISLALQAKDMIDYDQRKCENLYFFYSRNEDEYFDETFKPIDIHDYDEDVLFPDESVIDEEV